MLEPSPNQRRSIPGASLAVIYDEPGGALAADLSQPDQRELAGYPCAGPAGLPLVALVRVAGARREKEALAGSRGRSCLAANGRLAPSPGLTPRR
jgi:hypothetical protein